MRLWQRACGVFKDHHSIWLTSLPSGCVTTASLRNSDIEKAVIRSTSHSDLSFDRRSLHRVCDWLRFSPYNLVPLLRAVSRRMAKTRDWTVALKGLYLMHIVIDSRLPCAKAIGRLPFDLSNFNDDRYDCSSTDRSWPFHALVRAYYAYLDQKSAIMFLQGQEIRLCRDDDGGSSLIARELAMLQKLQSLVDLLLQIRPQSRAASVPLILEVMDCITIDIYDMYSRICRGIALVLVNIYSSGKAEAKLALNVVQKANQQGEDLSEYLRYCRKLGISYPSGFPTVNPISKEAIHELELIVNSFSNDEDSQSNHNSDEIDNSSENHNNVGGDELKGVMVRTDKWVTFDEEAVLINDKEIPDLISL